MIMKICPRCKDDKLLSEFNSEGRYCKVCHNEKGREWRVKNKEKYLATQKRECENRKLKREGREITVYNSKNFSSSATFYIKRRRLRNTLWVLEHFRTHPCVDCGNTDLLVLEFDHVRGKKEFNVGEMVQRGMSLAKIKKEVTKCDVRCANCHTKKTAKERNYMSYLVIMDDYVNSEAGKELQSPIVKIRVKKSHETSSIKKTENTQNVTASNGKINVPADL